MLDNLLSKVIAAGLAAGVFLLWWPAHLPSTGVQWLVLRGLAWTLAFEVLALSFVPLEQMATRAVTRRRSAGRADRVRDRLAAAPAPARASGAVMLAFTGLLLPGLLLLHTGHLPAQPAAAHTTQVVRKVVVRKVVHERTVVVREVAPAPVAASVPAQPAAPVAGQARREGTGEEAGACEEGRRQAGAGHDHDHDARPGRLGRAAESGRAGSRSGGRPRRPGRRSRRRVVRPPRRRRAQVVRRTSVFPTSGGGRTDVRRTRGRHAGGAAGARVAATPFPR